MTSRPDGEGVAHSTTTLTVWVYDSAMGASAGEVRLRTLEERGALTLLDAVTVQWLPREAAPTVSHVRSRTAQGARRGAVLGAFVGALVFAPVAGAAAGTGVGAIAGRLRRTGIDDAFLEEIRARLTPGTSAMLVLSEDADLDAVRPVLERGRSRGDVTLMHAVLSPDAPHALRELVEETRAADEPDDGHQEGEPTD